jgi:hypothetical protein
MKKEIKIGSVSFPVQSSAFTPFAYRNFTGRELLADLMKMEKSLQEVQTDENKAPDVVSGLLSDILQLAYVMNKEADNAVTSFEEWLKQFDGILDDNSWLAEVVATAAATFRRNIETN